MYIHIIHTTYIIHTPHTHMDIYRVFTKHSGKIQMLFPGVTVQLSTAQFINHFSLIKKRNKIPSQPYRSQGEQECFNSKSYRETSMK